MGLFDGSIGAFVLGTFFSTFLAGLTCTQVFYYYSTFGKGDKRVWLYLVACLTLIDLFHTATCCYTIYLWTVSHWGDLTILVHSPWTFSIEPAITGITSSIVQCFYAYRIYRIAGEQLYLPSLIVLLSSVQCGFAIGATTKIFVLDGEFARFNVWTYGVLTWLLSSSVADIIITFSLVYLLRRNSSFSSYQRTNSLVATILRQTIETNGLTMAVAMIDAILFAAYPHQSYHVIPQLCLVKLYFNSLLVSLNSREALAARLNSSVHLAYHDSGHSDSANSGLKKRASVAPFRSTVLVNGTPPTDAIHISMQEFVESDIGSQKEGVAPFENVLLAPPKNPMRGRSNSGAQDVERLAGSDPNFLQPPKNEDF